MLLDDTEGSGTVLLKLRPRPSVEWSFEPDDAHCTSVHRLSDFLPADLEFSILARTVRTRSQRMTSSSGWLQSLQVGDDGAQLQRAIVHWMNLPQLGTSEVIRLHNNGATHTYTGRTRFHIAAWQICIERRPDYSEVRKADKESPSIAITHMMEISRSDGSLFSVAELQAFLIVMHYGFSFALGRWVAPALPVGFDDAGERIWGEWGAILCDPGITTSLAWWCHDDIGAVVALIHRLAPWFAEGAIPFE
jgi:hypothetical protein